MTISRRDVVAGLAAIAIARVPAVAARSAGPSRDELTWLSATELREMIVGRRVSAAEVTEHFLARIDRLNPTFRAFVNIDHDGARLAARLADAAIASGRPLGALHGVPVAIKDCIWARGLPSTGGSRIFSSFRPTIDGTIVQRLRAAGAIIVGTTNMPEFGAWPRSQTYVAGETLNPWDVSRIPGASSGGCGAAVAAGMVPISVGTDGGGSIRIPSALCGIVGVYPTLGRVPDYGGFHGSPAGSAGPMTRSVSDAALLLQIIAGPDPRIAGAIPTAAPDVQSALLTGVKGVRIAWSPDFGHLTPNAGVVAQAELAARRLEKAGAQLRPLNGAMPHPWGDLTFMRELQEKVASGGYALDPVGEVPDAAIAQKWLIESSVKGVTCFEIPEFAAFVAKHQGLLTPPQRVMRDVRRSAAALPSAAEVRSKLASVFAAHDVLCTPTMPNIAPLAPPGWGSPYDNPYMGTDFTFIANATGCPAVTVPCGLVDGLPVGLQIIGPRGSEALILRVAATAERAIATKFIPAAGV